jgi:hypothetical protein
VASAAAVLTLAVGLFGVATSTPAIAADEVPARCSSVSPTTFDQECFLATHAPGTRVFVGQLKFADGRVAANADTVYRPTIGFFCDLDVWQGVDAALPCPGVRDATRYANGVFVYAYVPTEFFHPEKLIAFGSVYLDAGNPWRDQGWNRQLPADYPNAGYVTNPIQVSANDPTLQGNGFFENHQVYFPGPPLLLRRSLYEGSIKCTTIDPSIPKISCDANVVNYKLPTTYKWTGPGGQVSSTETFVFTADPGVDVPVSLTVGGPFGWESSVTISVASKTCGAADCLQIDLISQTPTEFVRGGQGSFKVNVWNKTDEEISDVALELKAGTSTVTGGDSLVRVLGANTATEGIFEVLVDPNETSEDLAVTGTASGTLPNGRKFTQPVSFKLALEPASDLKVNIVTDLVPEGEVKNGKTFEIRVKATNSGDSPLKDLEIVELVKQGGLGDFEVVSGPVPATYDVLEPEQSKDFVYRLKATKSGIVHLRASGVAARELVAEVETVIGKAFSSFTVLSSAGLTAMIEVSPDPVIVGKPTTAWLTLRNTGSQPLKGGESDTVVSDTADPKDAKVTKTGTPAWRLEPNEETNFPIAEFTVKRPEPFDLTAAVTGYVDDGGGNTVEVEVTETIEPSCPLPKATGSQSGRTGFGVFQASFQTAVQVAAADSGTCFALVVNKSANGSDADLTDGRCDVDLDEKGDQCTLRAAIQTVNTGDGPTTITFDLPAGSRVISSSNLPQIKRDDVQIDAASQTGGAPSTPGVTIVGSGGIGLDAQKNGFVLRNVAIVGFDTGLFLAGDGAQIDKVWSGVSRDSRVVGNSTGIVIEGSNTQIVDSLISGNRRGDLPPNLFREDGTAKDYAAVLKLLGVGISLQKGAGDVSISGTTIGESLEAGADGHQNVVGLADLDSTDKGRVTVTDSAIAGNVINVFETRLKELTITKSRLGGFTDESFVGVFAAAGGPKAGAITLRDVEFDRVGCGVFGVFLPNGQLQIDKARFSTADIGVMALGTPGWSLTNSTFESNVDLGVFTAVSKLGKGKAALIRANQFSSPIGMMSLKGDGDQIIANNFDGKVAVWSFSSKGIVAHDNTMGPAIALSPSDPLGVAFLLHNVSSSSIERNTIRNANVGILQSAFPLDKVGDVTVATQEANLLSLIFAGDNDQAAEGLANAIQGDDGDQFELSPEALKADPSTFNADPNNVSDNKIIGTRLGVVAISPNGITGLSLTNNNFVDGGIGVVASGKVRPLEIRDNTFRNQGTGVLLAKMATTVGSPPNIGGNRFLDLEYGTIIAQTTHSNTVGNAYVDTKLPILLLDDGVAEHVNVVSGNTIKGALIGMISAGQQHGVINANTITDSDGGVFAFAQAGLVFNANRINTKFVALLAADLTDSTFSNNEFRASLIGVLLAGAKYPTVTEAGTDLVDPAAIDTKLDSSAVAQADGVATSLGAKRVRPSSSLPVPRTSHDITFSNNRVFDNKIGMVAIGDIRNLAISGGSFEANPFWALAVVGTANATVSVRKTSFVNNSTSPQRGAGSIPLAPIMLVSVESPNSLGGVEDYTLPPNDPLDADSGPNGFQNYPELRLETVGGQSVINGTLNSTPSSNFAVDLYDVGGTCNLSGSGEARTFLSTVNLTTDSKGKATFTYKPGPEVASPIRITSTATALGAGGSGATSPISPCASSAPAETKVKDPAQPGDNELSVDGDNGFQVGDFVTVDPGKPNSETHHVVGFGSLIFEAPMRYAHATGASVVAVAPPGQDRSGPTITITSPTTNELTQGSSASLRFTCDDGAGVGVVGCTGPSTINTSTLGPVTIKIRSWDTNGNLSELIRSFTVVTSGIEKPLTPNVVTTIGPQPTAAATFATVASTTAITFSPLPIAPSVSTGAAQPLAAASGQNSTTTLAGTTSAGSSPIEASQTTAPRPTATSVAGALGITSGQLPPAPSAMNSAASASTTETPAYTGSPARKTTQLALTLLFAGLLCRSFVRFLQRRPNVGSKPNQPPIRSK